MALKISKTNHQTNYFNLLYNSIKRIPYRNSIDLSNGIVYTSHVDLDKYTYFIKEDFVCTKEMLNCEEYFRIKSESPILSILAIDEKLIITVGLLDTAKKPIIVNNQMVGYKNIPSGVTYTCTVTNNEQLINIFNENDILDIEEIGWDLGNKLKRERKSKIEATKLKNTLNPIQKIQKQPTPKKYLILSGEYEDNGHTTWYTKNLEIFEVEAYNLQDAKKYIYEMAVKQFGKQKMLNNIFKSWEVIRISNFEYNFNYSSVNIKKINLI